MVDDHIKQGNHIWYHGSGEWFEQPSLELCRGYRDFGRGFYLSRRYEHAERMALRRSRMTGQGYVYIYEIDTRTLALDTKIFRGASIEWLDFVLTNRKNRELVHCHDIVIGPTSDAETIELIERYNRGEFGAPEGSMAKNKLIQLLNINVYPTQMCICSETGIAPLKRIDYVRTY